MARARRKNPPKNVDAVHAKYKKYIGIIEDYLGHNGETYSTELGSLCSKIFGKKFDGVFPIDKVPKRQTSGHCLIFNLDPSNKPGSHWCAQYTECNIKFVYDSFGRKVIKGHGIKHSDLDAEQADEEENCGQRCIAWLICVYQFGIDEALKI